MFTCKGAKSTQQLTTPNQSYWLDHTNSYPWYEHHLEGSATMIVRSSATNNPEGIPLPGMVRACSQCHQRNGSAPS